MEIKLVTGATSFEAGMNVIKQIDINDFEMENLVVVPDSFSMQAENLIFEVLNLKSTFNIEVVGISRLASKILRNNNIAFQRISGLEEIFNIYKVVKQSEKEFKYFRCSGVDFCLKVLQIIKQFKACKIKPEQIKSVGDAILDKKMEDLKIIFSRYEDLLNEKLDLSKLLDYFIENAETNLNLSKTNLYFVNFDSFSLEINDFICKLAKSVNKICIGMAKPVSVSNAYIYENDIFHKTTNLAKQYNLNVKVESVPTKLKNERLAIVRNLFSFDVKKTESDYFVNIMAKNKKDEIEFVAKYIRNQVLSGERWKNFAIAVADKNYYEPIKTIFSQYGISSYCDDAVDLSQTILGRFLMKLIEIAKFGFNKENLQYIVSSSLFKEENKKDILDDIFYYNIEDEEEFLKIEPKYEGEIRSIKSLKKCSTFSQFSCLLKSFIYKVEKNYKVLLDQMQDELYYKKESENTQAKELIENVLDKLSDLAKDQIVDIFDFENLLLMSFKSVKVETIPTYVDAVFVGDATESYFEDVNTLIVLGATSNALPKNQNDTGIIDDDDIRKLKLNFALEPEIKVLNRRNRLKLFEMLQHGKNKLIVCTPMTENGKQSQKADFVIDLLKIFGENIIHTESLEDINLGILSQEQSLDKLLFYIGCKSNLPNAFSLLKAKEKLPYIFESSLNNLINTTFTNQNKLYNSSVSLSKNIFFKNDVVSSSQLETYFSCPFKHFVSYGLKIKQTENIEPNKRQFGIFQHALLKVFVETFKDDLNKLDAKQIDVFLNANVYEIAKKVYDEKILERKYFLNFLRDESKIILNNIVREQDLSSFRPFLLEKKISRKLNNNLSLIGFVDRIDRCGDYFRILDYKTGKTENIKKELYYGKKLQLVLYSKTIQFETGLNCAGFYYFDCQTKYLKANKNVNLLYGITLKDDEVVMMTDKTLGCEDKRSDLIGMSRKKNAGEGEFSFKNGNSIDNFQDMFEYSESVINQAINEIKDGNLESKPLKDECLFCPYISICKHRESEGFRLMKTIKDENLKRKN